MLCDVTYNKFTLYINIKDSFETHTFKIHNLFEKVLRKICTLELDAQDNWCFVII